MFIASFLLIAVNYDALPAQLPILRSPVAGIAVIAPKSTFTAYRVSLMNLSHGLIVAVMLSRSADFREEGPRAAYVAFFSTLLVAIGLKSDFEALELCSMVSPVVGPFRGWLAALTVLSVFGGVTLAFFRARKHRIPWAVLYGYQCSTKPSLPPC